MEEPRFLPSGDAAVTVEFGDRVDLALSHRVLALDAAIRRDPFPGLIETAPTFRSLLVHFEPLSTDRAAVDAALRAALAASEGADAPAVESAARRIWRFPIAYGGEDGPDLADVAARTELSEAAVVERHVAIDHHVFMLGFLPGAPFLGSLPPEIDLPRRTSPRVAVPGKTVAIAVGLTVIYPVESPGGWNLIGRTPVQLFDPKASPPALLRPGDAVRFAPCSAEEAASLSLRADAGEWRPELVDVASSEAAP